MEKSKPESTAKYDIRPAFSEEAGLSRAMPPEKGTESEESVPLKIRSLADLKRAIKPGAELMATYHAYHPEIVGLVRVVTEVQTNAFYSVVKGQPDHGFSTCNYGKGFRSEFDKASSYQFEGTAIKVLNSRAGDGSVLYEFEVYAPKMEMAAREKNDQGARDRYLSELRLQLGRAGFEVGEIENGSVDVLWEGAELCKAIDSGDIHYYSKDIADGRNDAFHNVLNVTRTVKEYMSQLEAAPPLTCTGLQDGFKLLAEFNGTVFAGRKYDSISCSDRGDRCHDERLPRGTDRQPFSNTEAA